MRLYRLAAVTAATLLAALAPALAVGSLPALVDRSLGQSLQILPPALGATLGHAIILGLPCFFILDSRRRVNLFSAITVGFAVGALPFGIFVGILASLPVGNTSSWTNGVPTVVNGVRTLAGWIELFGALIYAGLFGLFGALAGLVFWLTLKAWGWRAAPAEMATSLPERGRFLRVGASTGTLVLAVVVTTGVFAIPAITKDRTCHNMFRDGRTSVVPQVSMYVSAGMG